MSHFSLPQSVVVVTQGGGGGGGGYTGWWWWLHGAVVSTGATGGKIWGLVLRMHIRAGQECLWHRKPVALVREAGEQGSHSLLVLMKPKGREFQVDIMDARANLNPSLTVTDGYCGLLAVDVVVYV